MRKLILFIILIVIALFSCETTNKSRIEAFVMKDKPLQPVWLLNSIQVTAKSINNSIANHAIEIFPGIARQSAIEVLRPKNPDYQPLKPYLIADIVLSEKEFTKGLETLNSILAILKISEPGSKDEIAKIVYTEVSDSTIESDYHLFNILNQLCLKSVPLLKGLETENK